jgi:hypothetical protein
LLEERVILAGAAGAEEAGTEEFEGDAEASNISEKAWKAG